MPSLRRQLARGLRRLAARLEPAPSSGRSIQVEIIGDTMSAALSRALTESFHEAFANLRSAATK